MNKTVTTALDWPPIRSEITHVLSKIKYNHDIYKLLHNVDKMITELSKLEVEARQRKNTAILDKKITEINTSIGYVEKMITYLILVD